jgi:HEAT repeat protein
MENLIKALNSEDEVERIYAAQDIAESEKPELAEFLLKRLSLEESQAVKDAIIFALGNLSCSRIYPMIFRLFRSPDAYLRNAAIGIFGSEGKNAVSFLASHLNHSDREVRKLILDALFATGVPDAARAIRKCLYDSSLNVRITAAEYLGRMDR